ncbi:MAG: fibronectin type III domain-containing protein [Myxococcales bacterium]|nr:fibronectin type III domain-containing protein [Myxococcales bacterium]
MRLRRDAAPVERVGVEATRDIELDARALLREHGTFAELTKAAPAPTKEIGLRIDAWRSTPRGMQVVAARDQPLYDLAASDLHGVLVRGSGVVRGLIWLDWGEFRYDQLHLWRILSLPVTGGARYTGVADGPQRAHEAVKRGAPTRLGLHDESNVAGPSSSPAASVADEVARLEGLKGDAMDLVDGLLNDLSEKPRKLTRKRHVATTKDGTPTYAIYPALATLLTGAADSTIARYLGLLDRDEAPAGVVGDVVVYLVRGFWAVDIDGMLPDELAQLYTLAMAAGGIVTADTPQSGEMPFEMPRKDPDGRPIFDFFLPLITTLGAPPLAPGLPVVGPPVPASTGDASAPVDPSNPGHWNADYLPPEARREVELPVSELLPVAGLAAAREEGAKVTGLNRTFKVSGSAVKERARDLVPTLPASADAPNVGRVHDHHAPATAVGYRVAQHDWFGRWSGWRHRGVAEKQRPRPPTPVLRADYAMAAVPEPVHSNPLWGVLAARVRVPTPDSLPTGANLLASLQITGSIAEPGGGPVALTHAPVTLPANPASWPEELVVPLTPSGGGLLPRHGSAKATLRARWTDTAGQPSDLCAPVEVTCVDPRPPVAVVIDPTLRYAARPDALGRARVTLRWPVAGGQRRFRVFFADETRIIDRLRVVAAGQDPLPPPAPDSPVPPSMSERTAAQQLIAAWEAAGDDAAARAVAFTDRAALLRKGYFQQITREPLSATGGVTEMSFQHDLSGSLRVLAFYRVVSVSAQQVESPWADAPVVPFGVPNLGPPTQPMLEKIEPREDDPPLSPGSVRLKVRVLRGSQPIVAYRLRRSSVQGSDPLRMPVAVEAPIVIDASGDQPIEFAIDDAGAYAHDPAGSLRPFTRYAWRVEVQAPSLPGSSVPGEWSQASAAVTSMLVPDAPVSPVADAPTVDVSDASDKRVTLRWTYPATLDGGSLGSYRFDVYRRTPGGREGRVGSIAADKTLTEHTLDDLFASDDPPAGTTYRIVALDPTGRMSPPSDPVTIP